MFILSLLGLLTFVSLLFCLLFAVFCFPFSLSLFLSFHRLISYVMSSSTDSVGVPVPASVRMNSAVTVGRMAVVAAGPVGLALGQGLPNFLKKWCLVIMEMPDDEEKVDVCMGLVLVAKAHPQAVVSDQKTLGFLAHAFLSWDSEVANTLNATLINEFRVLFQGFAQQMGPQGWNQLKMSWGGGAATDLRERLQAAFGV